MTEEVVNELFKRYKESGDVAIRNQIAEKYLYIADILAKKFVGRGVEYDDLKQVASYALLRGIDRFNPDLGMQFTTFITPTITGEIKNYFRDKSRMVKLPRRLGEISGLVKKYSTKYKPLPCSLYVSAHIRVSVLGGGQNAFSAKIFSSTYPSAIPLCSFALPPECCNTLPSNS